MMDEWDKKQMIAEKSHIEVAREMYKHRYIEEEDDDSEHKHPIRVMEEKWWRSIKGDELGDRPLEWDVRYGINLWTKGLGWDGYPKVIDRVFIRGFGFANVIACPACGKRAEQYTFDENPDRYGCPNCGAITSNPGAAWYISMRG